MLKIWFSDVSCFCVIFGTDSPSICLDGIYLAVEWPSFSLKAVKASRSIYHKFNFVFPFSLYLPQSVLECFKLPQNTN